MLIYNSSCFVNNDFIKNSSKIWKYLKFKKRIYEYKNLMCCGKGYKCTLLWKLPKFQGTEEKKSNRVLNLNSLSGSEQTIIRQTVFTSIQTHKSRNILLVNLGVINLRAIFCRQKELTPYITEANLNCYYRKNHEIS